VTRPAAIGGSGSPGTRRGRSWRWTARVLVDSFLVDQSFGTEIL